MARIFYLLVLITFPIVQNVFSRPEKKDCEWVPQGEVTRIRDLDDCNKYYYCIKGKSPFQMACPWDFKANYHMYFNPNTTDCDYYSYGPPECFGNGGEGGSASSNTRSTTTTTTTTTSTPSTTTTTTKRPTRPPMLDEEDDFEIDCSKKGCGFFPNTYGPCDTYAVCVNGEKLIKKCNGGQKFDSVTRECVASSKAKCWIEPDAGPHVLPDPLKECPYHEFKESEPIETLKDGIVLENPIVTSRGEYGNWTQCFPGSYANGINAYRRVIMQGQTTDHAAITSISFSCRNPSSTFAPRRSIIQSIAPGAPEDEWPTNDKYYTCKGAVVGIQVNSVRENGWGTDQLGADNVKAICSCGKPAYKPYENPEFAPQNGNRGDWTAPQYCKRHQAVCGMQTQMQEYKEDSLGSYDNTGLNNLRVKCCDVPDPAKTCRATESRIPVRVCNNSASDQTLRCQFQALVGITMEESNSNVVEFYSSIGYSYEDGKKAAAERIEKELVAEMKSGTPMDYHWDEMVPKMREDAVPELKKMIINEFETVRIVQIVARCGPFVMRTNRFVRLSTSGQSQFEI